MITSSLARPATSYRLALALAVVSVAFLVLAIGALGVIGAGGEPDRVFAAVPIVFALGAVAARFRARWMAVALAATALTQAVVTLVVFLAGLHHTPGASVLDIIGINAMFVVLFAVSGWLFSRAAEEQA